MRTVYEDLSRFSASLSQCRNFESMQRCLQKSLKFLFNYEVVRFAYYDAGIAITITILPKLSIFVSGPECLYDFEKKLLNTQLPVRQTCNQVFKDRYIKPRCQENLTLNDIWSWHYAIAPDKGLITTVLSSDKAFNQEDIPVVKVVAENIAAKMLNTRLISELNLSNKETAAALEKLEQQNMLITALLEKQEAVIQERTQQLEEKNKKILKLYNMKAHSVREPLSRIHGLLQLTDLMQLEDIASFLIPKLNISANDLDYAIKFEIKTIDEEIFSSGIEKL